METARLWLRPLELADADQIQALFPQWEIVRYLEARVPWPYPPDGALTFIRQMAAPAMERGEQWHWTLRLKSAPGQIVGCVSLMSRPENNRGFWLATEWHGQGLMTEACERVTDYWFETIGAPVMRVSKATANAASRRISEKQGMRLVGTREVEYVAGHLPSEVWEITAEEWRVRRNPASPAT
jgi:RimJ/RimL family protein N-acetyltransferase